MVEEQFFFKYIFLLNYTNHHLRTAQNVKQVASKLQQAKNAS